MDPEADSYSGLHNNVGPNGRRAPTGLAGYLRERRIDPVVCCGLARDVCVKWTAQDAAAAGLRSLFIWDLTWPVDADNDDATRAELVVKEVEVVTAEALLTSFRRAAGGAHDRRSVPRRRRSAGRSVKGSPERSGSVSKGPN